jgi:hypothetical protein
MVRIMLVDKRTQNFWELDALIVANAAGDESVSFTRRSKRGASGRSRRLYPTICRQASRKMIAIGRGLRHSREVLVGVMPCPQFAHNLRRVTVNSGELPRCRFGWSDVVMPLTSADEDSTLLTPGQVSPPEQVAPPDLRSDSTLRWVLGAHRFSKTQVVESTAPRTTTA